MPQTPHIEPISREIDHIFCTKANDWGFSHYLSIELLTDGYGFVLNDSVILEVHLFADPPHGITRISKLLNDKGLKHQITNLLTDDSLVDIDFQFKNDNGDVKCLKAHKLILALSSNYFKDYFKEHKDSLIEIKNSKYEVFKDLLK